MKKFLGKAKAAFEDATGDQQHRFGQQTTPQANQPSMIGPPSPDDIIRYRYHHGTNLGSIFVLEQWLTGSMFPANSGGGSELDAVSAIVQSEGLDAARRKWENHWHNAVSDEDFKWLIYEARCTSIRLPIGYFTLGHDFCHGTPFERVAPVYENAWAAVKAFVERANSFGIGTLIDFHGLPGGANGEEHSGTTSRKAEFWGHSKNMDLGLRCLGFIAQEVRNGMKGVVGIQLVNEAVYDAREMYSWYEAVINEISRIDYTIPIYISDAWDLDRALKWTTSRHVLKNGGPWNPVIVDTHKYYTFSDADRSQSPQQIISRIPRELTELDGKEGSLSDRGEAQLIIGEYSNVLDGQTWARSRAEDKEHLVNQFGQAQSARWHQRAGGSYFWTYKMDWMDGGEWGFVEQTKKRNICAPAIAWLSSNDVKNRVQGAINRRQQLATEARNGHEGYWNQAAPGQHFEHDLYSQGWDVGFSDGANFFSARSEGQLGHMTDGADKIGCLDVWVKKRLLESGQRGPFVWEWEQGFRAGLGAFYREVGA